MARKPGKSGGVPKMMTFLDGKRVKHPPFAPPFLKSGKLVIGQTANILLFLGTRHGLAPRDEAMRLWTHQLQLTITDLVVEVHDTHHPISGRLYFEDQRREAKRRAADFLKYRAPKFLHYFERVLERSGGAYLLGRKLSYADLSLFQIVEGLRYAFPKAMKRLEKKIPRIVALHDRVAAAPAHRRLSRLGAAHCFQRTGDLSALQGIGCLVRALCLNGFLHHAGRMAARSRVAADARGRVLRWIHVNGGNARSLSRG